MTLSVHPVEAVWFIVNLTTFLLTVSAFVDARADRAAVKLLNGHGRELIANATIRREGIRLTIQVLLLVVVVPGLFSDRAIVLSVPLVALMIVPVLLLLNSFFDARDRKALTVLVAADIVSDASRRFDRIEAALAENTVISQAARDDAQEAASVANHMNAKLFRQQEAGLAQGRERDAEAVILSETIDTTAAQVSDLHEGIAPQKDLS